MAFPGQSSGKFRRSSLYRTTGASYSAVYLLLTTAGIFSRRQRVLVEMLLISCIEGRVWGTTTRIFSCKNNYGKSLVCFHSTINYAWSFPITQSGSFIWYNSQGSLLVMFKNSSLVLNKYSAQKPLAQQFQPRPTLIVVFLVFILCHWMGDSRAINYITTVWGNPLIPLPILLGVKVEGLTCNCKRYRSAGPTFTKLR